MLTVGHDSPNLRMLASLDRDANAFEAEQHFARALHELRISQPSRLEALKAYACEMAQQILDGVMSPEQGVRALYRLCVAAEYGRDFMVWYELDDALDDLGAGSYPWSTTPTKENIGEIIKTEARKFIDEMKHESAA